MSGTGTSIRKNDDKYGDDNANATAVIDLMVLSVLVTTLTGAITTAVSNTITTQPISVNMKTHSFAINPYNSKSMDLSTKNRNYQW